MSLGGQRIQPDRYTLVPRTLTFLTRPGEVLLMRVPPDRGAWAGLYNGIGGHVEQGEEPYTSALREVREETGLSPASLQLAAVMIVDTGSKPGIGLYVFHGEATGEPTRGPEGAAEWVSTARIAELPLVEDLRILLPRLLQHGKADSPYFAVYSYSADGALQIRFART